jgi:hypothetical protein
MTWWDNWLNSVCKSRVSPFLADLQLCRDKCADQLYTIELLQEQIRQLQLLVRQPAPPSLDYIVEKDTEWVEAQLQAMKLNIIRLPLDGKYKLTNRKNFANIVLWDTTDRLEYVRDFFDCDKFAMLFKVITNLVFNITQVVDIIDYKSGHSYDLILYPDSEPMVLEPQSDALYLWTKRLTDFYSLEGAWALI